MAKLYLGSTEVTSIAIGGTVIEIAGGELNSLDIIIPAQYPKSVEELTNVKTITFTNTELTTIDFMNFRYLPNLTSVEFKTSKLTSIESSCFDECPKLTTINIPASTNTIEISSCFYNMFDDDKPATRRVNFLTTGNVTLSGGDCFSAKALTVYFYGNPPTIGTYTEHMFDATTSLTIYYKSSNTKWTTSVKNNIQTKQGTPTITWKTF